MTLFNRFSRFALVIVMIAENAGFQGFIDPEALKLIFLLISVIIQILGPPHRQKRASVVRKISFCCVTRKQAEHCSKTSPRVKTKLSAPNEPTFQTYLPKKPLSYMFYLCSNVNMTNSLPQTPPTLLLPDEELLAFTPVPMDRRRSNGWTPAQQERFIRALDVMGSVGQAAMAVGMSRTSAYNLRDRPGAESFARSWDAAIDMGQQRQFDTAMERAINGVTTIRVIRGGAVTVNGGPDMRILRSAMRSVDEREAAA